MLRVLRSAREGRGLVTSLQSLVALEFHLLALRKRCGHIITAKATACGFRVDLHLVISY